MRCSFWGVGFCRRYSDGSHMEELLLYETRHHASNHPPQHHQNQQQQQQQVTLSSLFSFLFRFALLFSHHCSISGKRECQGFLAVPAFFSRYVSVFFFTSLNSVRSTLVWIHLMYASHRTSKAWANWRKNGANIINRRDLEDWFRFLFPPQPNTSQLPREIGLRFSVKRMTIKTHAPFSPVRFIYLINSLFTLWNFVLYWKVETQFDSDEQLVR